MKQASEKREVLFDCLWLFVLIAATSLWCARIGNSLSATFDEPTHLQCGLLHWRTGSYKSLMRLGAMPLPMDVQTLPLYLWERAHGVMLDPDQGIDWMLRWERAASLIFWVVLLVYVYRIARSIAGPWAGRVASAIVAFEPTLLGHAALSNTDICVTALLTVFAYEFQVGGREKGWRCVGLPAVILGYALLAKAYALLFGLVFAAAIVCWQIQRSAEYLKISREDGRERLRFFANGLWTWWGRLGVPALLYGFAMLGKASALVFAPIFMLVIETHRLWLSDEYSKIAGAGWMERFRFFRDNLWKFRREFFSIIFLGLAVTFLYIGSDWSTEPTFIKWAQTLKPGGMHNVMLWISEHLRIFTNAGEGLAQQIKHNFRGHASYILGENHKRAVWYYFPVALAIKCTIPFLFLPIVVTLCRRGALLNWPFLCALALLAYSFDCHVQIGIRFMFPLMVLAAAGCGAGVVIAMREMKSRGGKIALGILTAAGLAYSAGCSFFAGQDAICYTNEFWGGTEKGYLYLSDSNYDWGQGLKDLLKWREAHGVDVVDVWYFGLDPRARELPLRLFPLTDTNFVGGRPWGEIMKGKCVAVSTTLLYGPYVEGSPGGVSALAWLMRHQPTGRTTTFFIYDFRSL